LCRSQRSDLVISTLHLLGILGLQYGDLVDERICSVGPAVECLYVAGPPGLRLFRRRGYEFLLVALSFAKTSYPIHFVDFLQPTATHSSM